MSFFEWWKYMWLTDVANENSSLGANDDEVEDNAYEMDVFDIFDDIY